MRASGAGYDAKAHFREAHGRAFVRQSQVAGERDFQAAAECRARERGDDRTGKVLDGLHQGAEFVEERARLIEGHAQPFLQIRTRAEGLVLGTCEHDRGQFGLSGECGQLGAQGGDQRAR